MKKYLFGAIAALTIAAPMAAHAQPGYVGLNWTNADSDDDVIGVDGAFAFGGDGGLGFELDAAYAQADEADTNTTSVGGHVFNRTDTHLLGAFATYTDLDDASVWTAGVEAEKYLTNWTLAAAAGYGDSNVDGALPDINGW